MRCQTARALLVSIAMIATVTFSMGEVSAQTPELNSTSFQVERFEPMPAQGLNILNLATSDVLPHDQPSAGVFFHYVDDPIQLVLEEDDDRVVSRLVAQQLKSEVWAAVGIHDLIDLGFVLPIVFYQNGDELEVFSNPEQTVRGASLSDLRVVPKVRLVDPDWAAGLGVALLGTLYVPTGDRDTFNSDGRLRFEPRLAVDWEHPVGLKISGNLAYLFRPERTAQNLVVDDVVRYGLGAQLPTGIENFSVIGSFFGDIQLAKNRDVTDLDRRVRDGKGSPIELLGGLQYALPYNLFVNAGAGGGLTEGVGAPDFRVFASFGYTPTVGDRDLDGIYDDEDDCPDEPEDKDGFEDADGCPDYDNDNDGILDSDDACPNDPEDVDGFQDEDGCPDPDNDEDGVLDVDDECPDTPGPADNAGCPRGDRDGDGILDEDDQCPDDPEDMDGFEDEDGCPDLDNDQDGIPDTEDDCPNEPEDMDGLGDEDGCPETDFDKDGIPDEKDECPEEPETINGVEDDDGCPDEGETKVKVTEKKIEIYEKVYFDVNKAKIKPVSYSILNQVAQVLKGNEQITRIRVEGHTDSTGADAYNLTLSQKRAESVVEYLAGQGVSRDRLVAKGFGEAQPIADNDTKAGRDQNRRVEFMILEVNGEPVGEGAAVIVEEKEETTEAEETEDDGDDEREDDE